MRLAVVGVVLVLLGAAPAAAFTCEESQNPSTDLDTSCLAALNTAARAIYGDGRASLLAAADPVLLVGSDLTLLAGGQSYTAPHTPAAYTTLKQVSHLALGIFGALVAETRGVATGDGWRDDLETLAAAGRAVEGEIERLDLPPDQVANQRLIVATSLAFIDAQLAAGQPDAASLDAFARSLAGPLLANAAHAAAAQVDMLDAAMQGWAPMLGEDGMKRLYVLVMGPKNPRRDSLFTQYFEQLLGPDSADRVIYTEGVFDAEAARAVLGTVLIDRAVGAAFFGDPARMERDLLADGARVHILELFGLVPAQ